MSVRSVEILLHNLSHSDLVLSVNTNDMSLPNCSVIARPKFSHFREITEKLLAASDCESVQIESKPKYSRHVTGTNSYSVSPSPGGEVTKAGFNFSSVPVPLDDFSRLRFRRDDSSLLGNIAKSAAVIDAAYFPLVAVLIPKWLESISAVGKSDCRKIIFLISGRGTPIDVDAREVDNSTESTGRLITAFIKREYRDIEVIHLHSTINLFRYDENIVFVKRDLLPRINSFRDHLAHVIGSKWKECLQVTLSFADGASARISAINAALRHYRPNYMHFWQLKTFWSEIKLCEDDIECHSFEEISTEPAISLESTDSSSAVGLVIAEMLKFRDEFNSIQQESRSRSGSSSTPIDTGLLGLISGMGSANGGGGTRSGSDLASFWLRKTKKPVLSVLLVQKEGGQPKLYRGTNMEVSMPTGSLCAERNVIGSALADDMTLKRQDLKYIAVYSARALDAEPPSAVPAAMSPPAATPGNCDGHWGEDQKWTLANPDSPNFQNSHLVPRKTIPSPFLSGKETPGAVIPTGLGVNLGLRIATVGAAMSAGTDGLQPGTTGRSRCDSGESVDSVPPVTSDPQRSPTAVVGQKRKILTIPQSYSSTTVESTTVIFSPSSGAEVLGGGGGGDEESLSQWSPRGSEKDLGNKSPSAARSSGKASGGKSPPSFKSAGSDFGGAAAGTGVGIVSDGLTDTTGERATKVIATSDRVLRDKSGSTLSASSSSSFSSASSSQTPLKSNSTGRPRSNSLTKGVTSSNQKLKQLTRRLSKTGPTLPSSKVIASETVAVSADSVDTRADGSGLDITTKCEECAVALGVTTITVDENDMNPLKPCGACHEWLKKIAEVNPEFSVITFTDANCAGCYIEQITE